MRNEQLKIDFAKLDRAFNPRCVAVVGDNERRNFSWLRAESTFKGKLYSVQKNEKTIEFINRLGVENRTSLLNIPEAIDLVIVSVPRAVTPQILEDCIKKDVAGVHFFTAGFSETGTKEGIELENLIIKKAREANVHLIGPNCMGIFNPGIGIRQNVGQYTDRSGPIGFISQSGTHAGTFALEGHIQGIDVNKSVSFGNGVILDSTDYLEYFGQDDEIKAIGMYIEGVKDGSRFLQVIRKVASQKPVVIWKGGRTTEGGRAIASHTASLAVSQIIWETAIRQFGGINVRSMAELIDTLKVLIHTSSVFGDRVGLVGGSGGQSVAITDVFAEAKLKIPLLSPSSYTEFATFFTLVGGSYQNPIDNGNPSRMFLKRIVEILSRDEMIDNLVVLLSLPGGGWQSPEQLNNDIKSLINIRQDTNKPLMVIIPSLGSTPERIRFAREALLKLQNGNIPVFSTLEQGAKALKNAFDYYTFRKVTVL